MRTLRQCLFDCDLTLLRAIATQWGVELPTNRHDDAVDILTQHLTDPVAQVDLWASLPQAERRALAFVVNAGGTLPVGTFTRHFGDIRPMGPGRLERERAWEAPISTAESLWYRGLIFKAFDQGPGEMQEVVFMPQELHTMIEAVDASQPHVALAPAPAPSAKRQADAQLADDLCSLLAYLHATLINTAPGQPLPERHRNALTPQLRDPDPARLDLLTHLAAQLALVKPDVSPLRLDPQTVTAWLQSPTLWQQQSLFEGWRASLTWNDLWHVPTLICEDTGSWRNDPLVARRTVLDVLTRLEPGAWYRLDDFVALIRETWPDFQRPGGDYATWYIRDAATNQYLKGFESWEQVEGALLRFIVSRPLHWLGVVDRDTEGAAFCLTSVGYWVLGLGNAPARNEASIFVVHTDGQVDVSASRRYDRFQLARAADWVKSGETYTYRITPSSLERARARRITPDRIIDFLARASGAAIPESLAGALHRWGARGTLVWVRQAMVLRVARPEWLDQLMDSPRTRRYIREVISSTVALVALRDWPDLRDALFEMGILPDIEVEQNPQNR